MTPAHKHPNTSSQMNTSEERSADTAAAAAAAPTSGDEPPHEEEQRWVDASIRWDDHQDDVDDEESDDERDAFDPFKEDPSQSFTFAFHLDEASSLDANSRPPAAGNADGAASSSAAQEQAPPGEQDDESPQPNANVISIKLNGYKYDSDETFNSTGLTLWRAAEHLCYYLIRHRDVLQNKRMCELGCGLGLCGILAHRLTALAGANVEKDTCKENTGAVYLTDGDTDALAQLRANVRLNAPPSESNAGAIHCNQLIWGRQNTANFLQRHCSNRKFDILMASDVVYVADIIAPLMETVQTLLAPDGVFWFAYCSRRNVPVKIDLVLEAVLESGLVYEGVEEVDGIMIYEIRWGASGGNAEKSETDNGEKMEDAMSSTSRSTTSSTNEPVRPFEWLTNFSSLSHLLSPTYLFPKDRKIESIGRALHVGCGTSTLGECLVEELGYTEVVNADVDEEALSAMEKRWSDRCSRREELEVLETMKWQKFDFGKVIETSSDLTFERGYFDAVVDKSTLDCALCSGDGAAGLMVESYNALRPDGGVYVCISFNHVDFIGPLVRDCPGTDWDVEHVVVKRKVDVPEHLAGRIKTNSGPDSDAHIEQPGDTQSSAWTDGSFNPDDEYRRQCNVFICRRNGDEDLIHFDVVRDHLHRVNDAWFKTSNPMVTHTREADLRAAFESRLGAVHANDDHRDGTLPLRDCFDVLFTEAEREHLTFEFFLEDWEAFCANHDNASKDSTSMTVDTALLFLKEMQ